MDRNFDVIVVGAGPCGEAVVSELGDSELSVAVVESHLVGGECPYYACIPTKTMLRSAEVVAETRRGRELAFSDVDFAIDYPKIATRVSWMARDLDDSRPAKALQDTGATLFRGQGLLTGPGLVEVDGEQLTATRGVVISTGTAPAVPSIPGIDGVPFWTNRDAVLAAELPRSLIVLGGGAVGVELAQAFGRLGTRVTLVEGAPHLVPAEEPEAGALIRGHLEADGVHVIVGAKVVAVVSAPRPAPGGILVELGQGHTHTGERLLVATGRKPNLEGIDLALAGLATDSRGWLRTDPVSLLAGERVWAGGDITGIAPFTHVADYHGRVIARSLLGSQRPAATSVVPRATFTDPEIASVGLTEAQARSRGLSVLVIAADAAETARGYIHGFTGGGLVKVVVDRRLGLLVGATIVSPRAGEMIGELALAMRAQVPVSVLGDTIHAFPTFSRVLQGVLDQAARG
ncbi:MAG: NAD(P)/FAD-dependent oxidoreductase [Candidatus Dormibacteraeota bacterium]|nr:NAD(P)/FAD-dependent oxidoreductase [Candidatus Dormibacteraeota bacterium]